ncbi:virulence factor SrfB [uncultured Desulfovibrio sp.]|uniref:virulence factor SrfB n=1 Tax=uncultured Desulfovibrio sp. TaxID=167968 RepID=UPI002626CBAE|nr:virulence factor SrfB [uncultured Desulfovibrio sp.]
MDAIPRYLSPVSIIPGGCPQFLDFALPEEAIRRVRRYFREEKKAGGEGQGRYTHYLRCLAETDNGYIDQLTGQPCDEDYSVEARRALDAFEDHWLPVPFLRTLDQLWPDGGKRFECGPSNWARARVMRSEKLPGRLRVVLMFDTNVEERPEGEQYHALSPQDVTAHGHFMLAHLVRDNSWFLNAAWVDEWLYGLYDAWRQAQHKGRGSWHDDNPYMLEHLAAYLTWLEVVRTALNDLAVQVINPERDTPVDVDLVLDIGNSRTTGILVETLPQRVTNLNDSYLLELRDLSRPENIYDEPFETRVEFVDASFGNDALSRRSGRKTPAFAWPSAVRIGPEAARLATQAVCAEGTTGMSSPKRYLWDERPWQQSWRYNSGGKAEPMVSRGLFPRQLNPQGTPLACFGDPLFKRSPALQKQQPEPIFESLFTRSSLMLFMLGEILTQALVTINSPTTRSRRELPNLPRRLRRLIFTVPTAMPVAERRIFRRWVTWAVRVVWDALGWSEWYAPQAQTRGLSGDYRRSPQARCDWDEASCSQLVLLYNELAVKQHGDAHHLFRLMGKPRAACQGHPCVRMASIDIGGGTTDLSITTFELASGEGDTARIRPHTEFRDGFNIAGDEVLREVVATHVIPAIGNALAAQGLAEPRALLGQLFGRDAIGMSQEDRNTRVRLVRQIAVPVALGLLSTCENPDLRSLNARCRLRDFFEPDPLEADAAAKEAAAKETEEGTGFAPASLAPRPQPATLREVETLVRRAAPFIQNFNILDVPISVTPAAVEETIRATLGPTLSALCEVVHMYDCDALLLTGRPSSWDGVIASVLARLPVPPDRIIPMRRYHAGAWYPFADARGRVTDPKTTVVVGAILCALADGHLEGFSFDSGALRLTSTARYIGEMDINSQLRRPKVWFTVDVDSKEGTDATRSVAFSGPLSIGYRQLDAERWPTTRYHLLTFADEEARARASGRLPYRVEVRLSVADVWDEDEIRSDADKDRRSEGEFSIESIVDSQERAVDRRDLEIRLQTLKLDEGYWLDTGIVTDAG